MRALNLVDLLIIGAVLAVLVYAGSQDFGRYTDRTFPVAPMPAATPGS